MTHSQSLRIMGMVMSPGPSLLSTVFHLSGFSSYLLYLSVPSSPNPFLRTEKNLQKSLELYITFML